MCEETFQKHCQITFVKSSSTEIVKKCYTPVTKVCDGTGPEICKTVYESSCTTKYVDKAGNGSSSSQFVGDTQCEKFPVQICGRGCETQLGEEECHDKKVHFCQLNFSTFFFISQKSDFILFSLQEDVVIDVPQEICDLNPQKTCRMANKLVPKLTPTQECTLVPKEVCNLTYGPPKVVEKPYLTEWCLDNDVEDPSASKAAELSSQTPETPPEQARSRGRGRRRFRNNRRSRQRNQRQPWKRQ